MKSFSVQGMKRHPSLIPLVVIVGVGMAGAVFYTARLALRNPDVSWNKKSNAEPWQEFKDKQYKFWTSQDYSTLPKSERPEF
ncbi:cytochrome c oxidase subunit NDUFA4 [Dermacentor andersoni]|uniref:cytochrome c oxidase subunit NDUFA4 n=1 Tax=Dermacentor andersoni TaxID=34620 RepID=UPI0021557641|nr:cytochrome c oxidase subunit NDUFA4-like [Dermacentor andersoni]